MLGERVKIPHRPFYWNPFPAWLIERSFVILAICNVRPFRPSTIRCMLCNAFSSIQTIPFDAAGTGHSTPRNSPVSVFGACFYHRIHRPSKHYNLKLFPSARYFSSHTVGGQEMFTIGFSE